MDIRGVLTWVNSRPISKNITKVRRKGIDNSQIIIYDRNKSAINEDGTLHCFTEEEMTSNDWEIIE